MKLMLISTESLLIPLELREKSRTALLGSVPCALTQQEFALLHYLARHPNRPVTREMLLRAAWGYAVMCDTRTVDVHIQRLRKKLGVPCIETVFREGYLLRAQETEDK